MNTPANVSLVKLLPNTLEGLSWGLTHFDGIEFDLRLTQDDQLVIFHDPYLPSGQFIADLTLDQLTRQGISTFKEFMEMDLVRSLTEQGRRLWIEIKPNCQNKERVLDQIKDKIYSAFWKVMDEIPVHQDRLRIIGFPKVLIQPFAEDLDVHPIIPDINECDPSFITLKALPQFFRRTLRWHMEEAVGRNFAGVMFARQYIMGWMSIRHPSYKILVKTADELGLELGTNLGDPTLEREFPRLHRVSDKLADFPRYSAKGEGDIIAHRGTGTKGVEVPEESVPNI